MGGRPEKTRDSCPGCFPRASAIHSRLALLWSLWILCNCITRLPVPLASCYVGPMGSTSRRFQVDIFIPHSMPLPSSLLYCTSGSGHVRLQLWLLWGIPSPRTLALAASSRNIPSPCPSGLVLVPGCLVPGCFTVLCGTLTLATCL